MLRQSNDKQEVMFPKVLPSAVTQAGASRDEGEGADDRAAATRHQQWLPASGLGVCTTVSAKKTGKRGGWSGEGWRLFSSWT